MVDFYVLLSRGVQPHHFGWSLVRILVFGCCFFVVASMLKREFMLLFALANVFGFFVGRVFGRFNYDAGWLNSFSRFLCLLQLQFEYNKSTTRLTKHLLCEKTNGLTNCSPTV